VQTELPNQATAWQRFMRTGPLAFLPLSSVNEKHFCSIVWSADIELADELMQLNDAEFCTRLGFAFEHKLGKIIHTAERFAIPLRQRHAKTYIQPNTVLVGDAAHNIHPLAGQGVNLGLLDVTALADEIQRALDRKIPLSDFSILRRYQRQRLGSNLMMMSAMEAFKRLFGSESLMLTWLRNSGMRQLNSFTELKKIIVKSAMGLD
jgi:2-octaprenylphenol hydroxylase